MFPHKNALMNAFHQEIKM